jgi:hypothetical protein
MVSGFGRVMTAAALLVLGPMVTSCGMGKAADCDKLTHAANAQQETVKKAKGSQSPSDLENMATAFENAAKGIAAVELKDEKLKQYAKSYQDVYLRAAKDCRDMAAAYKAKDVGKANKANTSFQETIAEESKIVNNINNYCQGH